MSKMRNVFATTVALSFLVSASAFGGTLMNIPNATLANVAQAQNTTGVYAFFPDDRNQFVEMWLNTDGNISVKVSNGRPWRPMWVVAHAQFYVGDQLIASRDFHVYCRSPNPGGHGAEQWFKFSGAGLAGVTRIYAHTNKEAPWKQAPHDWEPPI